MNDTSPQALPVVAEGTGTVAEKLADAVLEYVGKVPESLLEVSVNPLEAARKLAVRASMKAAGAAGTLALPPGPTGWLTILPELLAVWKIQAQLVADIAALYGKKTTLTREQMLYCLFRHTASQVFRDLVVRVGERVLVKRASLRVLKNVATTIGIKTSQRVISKGISRWIPVAGAFGVGAYAYYDTNRAAKAAMELFAKEIEVEESSGFEEDGSPAR